MSGEFYAFVANVLVQVLVPVRAHEMPNFREKRSAVAP